MRNIENELMNLSGWTCGTIRNVALSLGLEFEATFKNKIKLGSQSGQNQFNPAEMWNKKQQKK